MSQAQAEYTTDATRELHDQNTALKILNRRLRMIVILAEKAFEMIALEGKVFLKPKTLDAIQRVILQIDDEKAHMSHGQNICDAPTSVQADAKAAPLNL